MEILVNDKGLKMVKEEEVPLVNEEDIDAYKRNREESICTHWTQFRGWTS